MGKIGHKGTFFFSFLWKWDFLGVSRNKVIIAFKGINSFDTQRRFLGTKSEMQMPLENPDSTNKVRTP